MPVTLREIERIRHLHEDLDQHDRCDIRKCREAKAQYAELIAPDNAEPSETDKVIARALAKWYRLSS